MEVKFYGLINVKYLYVISDLGRDRKEICTILAFYVAVAFNNNNNNKYLFLLLLLHTEVSGQPIGPIFKGHLVFIGLLDHEDETDWCCETSVLNTILRCVDSQKSADLVNRLA
jgi:hypothetical protein